MSSLELKKLQVELLRVSMHKGECELRVQERQEEIQRLEDSIRVSEAKEIELKAKIAEMQK